MFLKVKNTQMAFTMYRTVFTLYYKKHRKERQIQFKHPEPRILEDKFIQKQTTKQEEQKSTSKSVEQNEKTTPPHSRCQNN